MFNTRTAERSSAVRRTVRALRLLLHGQVRGSKRSFTRHHVAIQHAVKAAVVGGSESRRGGRGAGESRKAAEAYVEGGIRRAAGSDSREGWDFSRCRAAFETSSLVECLEGRRVEMGHHSGSAS